MICHLFPGQPVSLNNPPVDDDVFRDIARTCVASTGFDPRNGVCVDSGMTESVRLQLFGCCCSILKSRQLASEGSIPDLIAEHSMGIYAALATGGVVTAEDAIEMTFRVGMRMAESFRHESHALGCVIGMTIPQVSEIARNHGVYLANCNTSRHVLLAGPAAGIRAARLEAEERGAFSVSTFACDAPLHTPLMEIIADDLRGIFADYRYQEPAVPLMEHVNQQFLTAAAIPGFLCRELCLPVQWEQTYRALRRHGVQRFIEVGAGKALTKFNRWIDSES
jgi:malonyl CoA-acyl carrier protein transacylase